MQDALRVTKAKWVIITVGDGESLNKNDIRTVNAQATVRILQEPEFRHVRVLVVSRYGAGKSRIKIGLGLGRIISYNFRGVLADHSGQEKAFRAIRKRVTIVRAFRLTDGEPTRHLAYFSGRGKCPLLKTDRADLAAWIVREVCTPQTLKRTKQYNLVVNVTSVK